MDEEGQWLFENKPHIVLNQLVKIVFDGILDIDNEKCDLTESLIFSQYLVLKLAWQNNPSYDTLIEFINSEDDFNFNQETDKTYSDSNFSGTKWIGYNNDLKFLLNKKDLFIKDRRNRFIDYEFDWGRLIDEDPVGFFIDARHNIFKDSNSPNVVMSWSSKIVTWIKTFQETLGPIKYHEGDNWLYGFVEKLDR